MNTIELRDYANIVLLHILVLAKKGEKISEETKRKMSLASKGRKASEETKRKLSLAHLGRKASEETLVKMRGKIPWNKNKTKKTDSRVKKISEAVTGRKHTEESKRKIRAARARQVFTEETRRKRGESVKRHIAKYGVSAEHRKKIGLAHKGKKHSGESKKRMSEGQKKRYADGAEPWNKGKTGIYSAEVIEKMKERRAKQKFPSKDTVPEKFLQELCSTAGMGFYKHKNFNLGFQRHDVDLFIEPNICLEVDGDWPHANPKPFTLRGRSQYPGFKANDIIRNVSRTRKKALLAKDIWETDRRQTEALTQLGNIVIRFWQTELEQNPQKCLEKIINTKRSSRLF